MMNILRFATLSVFAIVLTSTGAAADETREAPSSAAILFDNSRVAEGRSEIASMIRGLGRPGWSLKNQGPRSQPWLSPDASQFAHGCVSNGSETWTLAYKFQAGQKLRYETHQTMTLDAQIAGQERRIDFSEMIQRRLFTVTSVEPAGDARLAMQFEHVWMKKKIDDLEPVEFDSKMKLSEVPSAFRLVAHDLRGVAPKYWLSAQGESLYPKADSSESASKGGSSKAANAKPLVEGQPSESGITLIKGTSASSAVNKQNGELDPGTFLMLLPVQPVRVGDSWKETVIIPVRVTADVSRKIPILRTYRLQSVENGIATIGFGSSIDTPVKGATVRAQLIQATPQGSITFDIERGLMLRREMRYNESVVGATGRNDLLSSVGVNTEVLLESTTP